MTCEIKTINDILKAHGVSPTLTNIKELVKVFSNPEATVEERQNILNTTITKALNTRNTRLSEAYTNVPPELLLDIPTIRIEDSDLALAKRRSKPANDNILQGTVIIAGKTLSDMLIKSSRGLNSLFKRSLTLGEWVTTPEGVKAVQGYTNADNKLLQFIFNQSIKLNQWFKGPDGKGVLAYMDKSSKHYQYAIGSNATNSPTDTQNDYLKYFLKEDSNGDLVLDELVLEAVNFSIYNWMTSQARETYENSDEQINIINGRDSNKLVSPKLRNDFIDEGSVQAVLIDSIGKAAFKQLGLKQNPSALIGNFEQKAQVALGELAVRFMLNQGILEQRKVHKSKFAKSDGVNDSQRVPNQEYTLFLRVKDNQRKNIDELSKLRKEENSVDELINLTSYYSYPSFKPVDKVVKYLRRTKQEVTKKTSKLLEKLQSDKWEIKSEIADTVFKYSQEFQNSLFGILSEEQINNEHITQRKKLVAENNRILRTLEHFESFNKRLNNKYKYDSYMYKKDPQNNPKPSKYFFMKYFVAKTGRTFIDNNTINPQNNKIIRHLVGLDAFNVVVDSAEKRLLFKLAVLQSFGYKIDKDYIGTSLDNFNDLLLKVEPALEVIRKGDTSKEAEAIIKEAIGSKGIAAYDGLVALSKYDPENHFNTSLPIEFDAVTSGVAIGIMQTHFPDMYNKLPAIGVFTDGTNNTYSKWISRIENNDLYQRLALTWNRLLNGFTNTRQEALKQLIGSFVDVNGIVEDIGRDVSKNPLMVTTYGSGTSSPREDFVQAIIDKFYTGLAKSKTPKKDLELIESIIRQPIKRNPKLKPKDFVLDFRQEMLLRDAIDSVYGETLESALEVEQGSFFEFRNYINKAFQVMFAIFNTKYKIEIAKYEKANRGSPPSLEELEKIIDKIANLMPVVKGPLSEGLADGILAIKGGLKRKYTAAYKVQQQYRDDIPGVAKSITSYASAYEYKDPGVSGTVINIHNLDSAIQQALLRTVTALNIHDAAYLSLDEALQGPSNYNEAFLDINNSYNLMEEVLHNLNEVLRAASKDPDLLSNKGLVKKELEDNKALLFKIGDEFETITLKQFRTELTELSKQILDQKKEFIDNNPSINVAHMAGPDGTQHQTRSIQDRTIKKLIDDVVISVKGSTFISTDKAINILMNKNLDKEFLRNATSVYENNSDLKQIGSFEDYLAYLLKNGYTNVNIHYGPIFDKYDPNKTVTAHKDLGSYLNFTSEENGLGWRSYRESQKQNSIQVNNLENTLTSLYIEFGTNKDRYNDPRDSKYQNKSLFDEINKNISKIEKIKKEIDAIKNQKIEKLFFALKITNPYVTNNYYLERTEKSNINPSDLIKQGYDAIIENNPNGILEQGAILNEQYIRLGSKSDLKEFQKYVSDPNKATNKGSSSRSIDFENFVAQFSDVITSENIQTIFDTLQTIGSKRDSVEHTERLKEVLTNVTKIHDSITLKVGESDAETFGAQRTFKSGEQDIHILGSKSTYNNNAQLSAQEVYVHELVHAVVDYGIDTNAAIRNAIKKLFKQAEKSFTYEHFLPANRTNHTAEEIATAKETYNYIFNSKRTEEITIRDPKTGHLKTKIVNPYLHEFVAYGLTNENFIKKLATIKTREKSVVEGNLWKQLVNWFNNLIEWLADTIQGVNGLNADVALRHLVDKLVDTHERRKYQIFDIMGAFDTTNNVALNTLNNYILEPFQEWGKQPPPTFVPGRILHRIAALSNHDTFIAWGKIVKQVSRNIGLTERSFLVKLVREVQGMTEDNARFTTMLRISKKSVDQARMHEADTVKKQILSYFDQERLPNKEESEALYKVFMKLDIASFLDTHEKDKYSPEDILNLLTDKAVLQQAIDKVEDQLTLSEYGSNRYYYIRQARGLGKLISIGKDFVQGQMKNAYSIAHMTSLDIEPKGDLVKAEKLIDELATLYGLQETNPDLKQLAANVYKRENARDGVQNGITNLLYMIKLNKEMALEQLFYGLKPLTEKGYTREAYDPNIDIKISPLTIKRTNPETGEIETVDMEKELAKEGYVLNPTPLPKDPNDKISGVRYMFVNDSSNQGEWMKSIVSLTSRQYKGQKISSLLDGITSQEDYITAQEKLKELNKEILADVHKQVNKKVPAKETSLLPITNDKGEIVDYRYVMNQHTKDTIMNQDTRFEYALGRMFGSIKDKVNSAEVNSQTLKLLKKDYDENFGKKSNEFVILSANSQDKEIAEIYKLMPEEMKREISSIWGIGEPVYVREEFINLIFGFRKLSVKDAQNIFGQITRAINDSITWILQNTFFPDTTNVDIGKIWASVVDLVKELIVVKSMVILIPNFVSNMLLNFVKGIGLVDQSKYMAEALIELTRYKQDLTQRDILKRELASDIKFTKAQRLKKEKELARLDNDLSINPVADLIDEGIFQSIIEDVEFEEDIYSVRSKIGNKASELADKYFPDYLKPIYKHLYLTKDTKPYQLLLKATQVSDFMARYALYQHRLNKMPKTIKTDEERQKYQIQVLSEVVQTFVNYDMPTSRQLQWINNMGLFMFTKFYFRIQKIIFGLFIDIDGKQKAKDNQSQAKPINVLSLELMQNMLFDMPDIADTFVIYGGLLNRFNTPFDILGTANDIPLYELVTNGG